MRWAGEQRIVKLPVASMKSSHSLCVMCTLRWKPKGGKHQRAEVEHARDPVARDQVAQAQALDVEAAS